MSEVIYLLWSNKHNAWWAPGAWGYTDDIVAAGRFGEAEAVERVIRSAQAGIREHPRTGVCDGGGPGKLAAGGGLLMVTIWAHRMPRAARITWRAAWPAWVGLVKGNQRGIYVRVGDRALFITRKAAS